jgi:autotransporter translocation and assembly factor TamB
VKGLGADAALAAGALADPQGRVLLDLLVSGNAKSPRVALDTKAMQARLAGKVSEALAQQTRKLEADAKEAARQALLQQLGAPRDTTKPALNLNDKSTRDSLERSAKDLFKNIFGKPKQPATPPPAQPAPPSAPDTTKH